MNTSLKLSHVGKIDFSKHPQLAERIEQYRKRENLHSEGGDMGMMHAAVGFFMDNLPLLYEMLESGELAYLFEDKRGDEKVRTMCDLGLSSRLQVRMIPHAIQKNKYFRSREARGDIGQEAAEQDFFQKRAYNWGARFRPAFCAVICQESPYCSLAQDGYFGILREKRGHI
jgi:hypothetical protein